MPTNTCQGCGKEFQSSRKRSHCPGECTRIKERTVTLGIWRSASPQRKCAHRLVHEALEQGRLTPQPCEVCGAKKAVAHHDNYAAPLDVRWLCRGHHKDHHNQFGPGANA